jgi:hypothetical protein
MKERIREREGGGERRGFDCVYESQLPNSNSPHLYTHSLL